MYVLSTVVQRCLTRVEVLCVRNIWSGWLFGWCCAQKLWRCWRWAALHSTNFGPADFSLQFQPFCCRHRVPGQRATPEHYYKQSVKLNWISFYFGHYTAAVGAGNKIAFLVIVWQRRNCFQKDIRLAAEARMARSPPSSIIRKLFKHVWVWQLKKPINKHFGKYFPRDRLLIIYL